MRFFFRSRGFKIIVAVAAALIAVSVIFAFVGSRMSPQADIMGTLTAPFRSAEAKVTGAVSDFINAYSNGEQLALENESLKARQPSLKRNLPSTSRRWSRTSFIKTTLK